MNISGVGQLFSQAPRGLSPAPVRESVGSGVVDTSVEKDAQNSSQSEPAVDSRGRPVPTPAQEQLNQQQISQLSKRDREVRAHEQAHAAVGGSFAGAPNYSFKRGPDGNTYAVGGEVSIDVGAIANDPAATVRKMEQVQRAALAPAQPSGQDLQVAAQAQVLGLQARTELAANQVNEAASANAEQKAQAAERKQAEQDKQADDPLKTDLQNSALTPNLQVYRRISELQEPASVLDVVA